MFKYYFDKRPVVENSQRTNVSVFIRHNYLQVKDQLKEKGVEFDFNNEKHIKLLIEMIEQGVKLNLKQEINGKEEYTQFNAVKLTYTRSNLGKGFVFWFICNHCGKRVKYLYFPPNTEVLACRICHRLAYKKQNEGNSRLSKKMMRNYI